LEGEKQNIVVSLIFSITGWLKTNYNEGIVEQFGGFVFVYVLGEKIVPTKYST